MARLQGALETIYFNDLDYIMGSVGGAHAGFLARSPSESYTYDPNVDMLTAEEWNEVAIKDAWYRARIKNYFIACGLGGTPAGIRQCINAALGVDAEILETWRYEDNFGLGDAIGRAPVSARNEVTVVPHKDSLEPVELRLARDMLARMCPADTIITVNTTGLSVVTPVSIAAACADSSYFEVQKMVVGTPALDSLPPPELLPVDLLPTERWIFETRVKDINGKVTICSKHAPYCAFNICQEHCTYYLVGGGVRSPVDSVIYGTLQPDGTVKKEESYEVYTTTQTYTDWISYELADSPDNYPGGKWGKHPSRAPARNPDGSHYVFPWPSQAAYIDDQIAKITALGGIADHNHYKLPIAGTVIAKIVYYSDYAVCYHPPAKECTVTKSLTYRKHKGQPREIRNPSIFAR